MAHEELLIVHESTPLIGVVTRPDSAEHARPVAFVIMNAGLTSRVGPSRTSVVIARELAKLGFWSIRFDHSSRGDSGPRGDTLDFLHSSVEETRQVMDRMQRHFGVEEFVLLGLCSGAVTAFKTIQEDDRVSGAIMMNGQVYEQNREWNSFVYNRGWARWYLRGALFQWDSWKRALTGRINYRLLLAVLTRQVKNKVAPPKALSQVQEKLANEYLNVLEKNVRLLLIYSENDRTLDYLKLSLGSRLEGLIADRKIQCEIIFGADHTFTLLRHQRKLLATVLGWAATFQARNEAPVLAQAEPWRESA